jgi:hypothetical protein
MLIAIEHTIQALQTVVQGLPVGTNRVDFPKDYPFLPQLRKKRVINDHSPKGVAAHRRTKTVT